MPHSFVKLSVLTAAVVLLSNTNCRAGEDKPAAEQRPAKYRIVLVGDSTVTDNAGWGGAFAKLLDDNAECINLSAGGRSSLSFRTEGRWQKCLDLKPDFVLIQFGHNDQPGKGPKRETDPETTYRANMQRYVNEARKANIAPILVTSLTRRRFDDNGKIVSTLVPYVKVVREIAAQKNVPLIDLHAISIKTCENLGPAACKTISPKGKNGNEDFTHLNEKGAKLIGPLIAAKLAEVVPELKRAISLPAE